ncbi:biliverdin-producing heme oxygenase [Stakelama flava]|uniref:biliverdin-producing heme oxygenase n=1 Tax=Stakelama flava TaxID=2860338 RepID=UPI001FED0D6B|nr:biliverdin-producing heme oxygenase [Stakelama flava]
MDDWAARRRGSALIADLEAMGGAQIATAPPFLTNMLSQETSRNATIAGSVYVLEGSRLGGRFLARQVPDDFPTSYLDADQPSGHWRGLLGTLDYLLSRPSELAIAIDAARAVFGSFETAGRKWLLKE